MSYRSIHRDPPPMSLMIYGSWLKQGGDDVDILDTHISEDWRQELKIMLDYKNYDWIGLTVIIGQFMKNADEITQFIRKEAPGIPIKWGGVMCSVMPEEIRREYKPDMMESGGLRELPETDWGLIGDKLTRGQVPYYHMIMSSLGCPFDCSFCYKQSCGREIKYRSVESVCAEMDDINARCGGRVFAIGDDNFLTNQKRAISILEYCKSKGYYIEECIGHINNLNDDLIRAMAGVVHIFIFSIESVDPAMQVILNKRIKLHEIPDKLARLRSVGIVCNISFMAGLPGETDEELKANWKYMEYLRNIHPYIRGNCYLWFPLPKTRLTNDCVHTQYQIREYENANFWVHDKNDVWGPYFRPHLSRQRYDYLFDWGMRFNETFKYPIGSPPDVIDEVLAGNKPKLGEAT
ncbi:MAG: radical SAM protein [Dehalococcoidia bacterium]